MVKFAENAANRGLNEVSSDHFSGAAGIDDKEAGSVTAVDKKEDVSATAVKEKEDDLVAEEVAIAHRRRREEGVVPIHESTTELLQCDKQDRACVASLDQLATVSAVAGALVAAGDTPIDNMENNSPQLPPYDHPHQLPLYDHAQRARLESYTNEIKVYVDHGISKLQPQANLCK